MRITIIKSIPFKMKCTVTSIWTLSAVVFVILLLNIVVALGVISLSRLALFIFGTYLIGKILPWTTKLSEFANIQPLALRFVLGMYSVSIVTATFPKSWDKMFVISTSIIFVFTLFRNRTRIIQLNYRKIGSKLVTKSDYFSSMICGISSLLALISILTWQRWTPISFNGFWKYHSDVAILESYANSISLNGLSGTSLGDTDSVKYHWLIYGFASATNQFSELPPFIFLNWILPLIMFAIVFSLLFKTSAERTQKSSVVLLVLVIGPGLEMGNLLPYNSPTTLAAVPLLFIFCALLSSLILKTKAPVYVYFYLVVVVILLTGTKGSTSLVVTLGSLVTIVQLIRNRKFKKNQLPSYLMLMISISLGFTIGYILFFGSRQSFPLEVGISFNSVALVPICLLVIAVFRFPRKSRIFSLAGSILIVGIILSVGTTHPSGNELFFLFAGLQSYLFLVLRFGSVNFSTQILRRGFGGGSFMFWTTVIILAVVLLFSWKLAENIPGQIGKILRSSLELALPVTFVLLILLSSLGIIEKTKVWLFKDFFIVAILLASAGTIFLNLFVGPTYSNSNSLFGFGKMESTATGGISNHYFTAGNWVRKNTSTDKLWITNRYCLLPTSSPPNCIDTWVMGSALTARNFLFDGGAYVNGSWGLIDLEGQSTLYTKKELLPFEFISTPTLSEYKRLKMLGVSFIWLDISAGFSPEINCYTEVKYRDESIWILELTNNVKKHC